MSRCRHHTRPFGSGVCPGGNDGERRLWGPDKKFSESATEESRRGPRGRGTEGGREGERKRVCVECLVGKQNKPTLLPDLVILIEIEGVQWLETATCKRGFSLHTQILTAQRHRMADSLLSYLIPVPTAHRCMRRRRWRNFFLLSLRDSRLSRRGCRPTPTLNDPSVRLRVPKLWIRGGRATLGAEGQPPNHRQRRQKRTQK